MTGKLICTARATHRPRNLARYVADDDSFVIASLQPTAGAGTSQWTAGQPALDRVRFRCPSCSSDYQFRSERLHAFLIAERPSGATRRDVSELEAAF